MDDAGLETFLTDAGFGDATWESLTGDASTRRYVRLKNLRLKNPSAIVMDARKSPKVDVTNFLDQRDALASAGLRVPALLAQDVSQGFLVLEDLGDDLFARVLEREPDKEMELYLAATEAALQFAKVPPAPDMLAYDSASMAPLAGLALDWYAGQTPTHSHDLLQELQSLLAPFDDSPRVFVHRDYHAENLLWLPAETKHARVAMIDFQDARRGHPAYDLASLLQDVRRTVHQDVQEACYQQFVSALGENEEDFSTAYAVMGAQRALRILGVFARLSLHYGKPDYVDLIPRTWDVLLQNLDHPALERLKARALHDLPPPSDTLLKDLKARCGTIPMV